MTFCKLLLFAAWIACFAIELAIGGNASAAAPDGPFETPLVANNLDPTVFAAWVDGAETAVTLSDGPSHVVWTQTTRPQWDGVKFGGSKQPGVRHLRIGFKTPLTIGTVLARGGGALSVLKPDAAYPGNLADDAQWTPAKRIDGGRISSAEVGSDEYAVWTLPPDTVARALRFTHLAPPTDATYDGWLGGALVLRTRMVNIAPQAVATAAAHNDAADRLNDETNNDMWKTWDNGPDGGPQIVSPQHAEWVMLTWPRPVRLFGVNALWAGFSAADVQIYAGPAERHPRAALPEDWKTVAASDKIENQYPLPLGDNWLDFGRVVTNRAVRLRITRAIDETKSHGHLKDKSRTGRRVWLGELMALSPLENAEVASALPSAPATAAIHPPIPVRFHLEEAAFVTLVIDDAAGKRVRNLVSETWFPAGDNVAWWDGMNDLRRDADAARHGIYRIPAELVEPGEYQVRGLFRKAIDLHFEFSIYSAGNPTWNTADHTGGWLANHSPPSSALFVPGEKMPGGKPLVFLGSYVSEGTDGLAWVDLDGRKQGGETWVGGNWTGAPLLARDAGAHAVSGVHAYAGSAFEGELRLTALTQGGDKAVLKHELPGGKDAAVASGLAVHDGLIVCSLPKQKQLLFVDARLGKVLGAAPLDDPRGLAFDADGRLLVLAGRILQRYPPLDVSSSVKLPTPTVLITDGLDDPQQLALDAAGNIYISDRGRSHQVNVFTSAGKPLRAIGAAGEPAAGPYDPNHMNNPNGLTIDSRQHLWVAETDFQPKRVSVWTLDGKLVQAFDGPAEYGGGGRLDPADKTRFYFHGMEFKLDWATGTSALARVLYRPLPGDLQLPTSDHAGGPPELPIDVGGRRYFTDCYNSNPTNGSSVAIVWLERSGIAVPVAAFGRASEWDLLKTAAFKPRWPRGVDPNGQPWQNEALFAWSDLNGDGKVQPEEVTLVKAACGGLTVAQDLAIIASRVDGRALRFAPDRFAGDGVPVYDLTKGEMLVAGAQSPTSSGGDQALLAPNGWTVLTVAPQPFSPQSVGGTLHGKAVWSYPDLWPGLHASHESPPPDHPGELIGTTRLLGDFVTPKHGDAGPLWAVNGNQGNIYVFTADGLFVATFFKDVRQGRPWAMPIARRGMLLNDLTLHDENFWPSITQTPDGNVYLLDGGRTSLVRVDGLETIRRLPDDHLRIASSDLRQAQTYQLESEAERQYQQGPDTLRVAIRSKSPAFDGMLNDWTRAAWVDVDKSGVAAYFNSNSQPHNVTAALAVDSNRLYAAFRVDDPDLLSNSGESPNNLFKTGGALDLMIGADSTADPRRTRPVAGDERLLVTRVKGRTVAMLYRPVAPGAKSEPVEFSSPLRTVKFDRVDDVSDQVRLESAVEQSGQLKSGTFAFSIPLSTLALKAEPGEKIRGDIGILRGSSGQTLQRVYWRNKATGITSDIPSEAELTPQLWGTFEFDIQPSGR
jgi:hypothetical protein